MSDCENKPTMKEPDGPPRDWPSIWRQQLREHIERAPMIPREYIDEVLRSIDAGKPWLPEGESVAVVSEIGWKSDEVKP